MKKVLPYESINLTQSRKRRNSDSYLYVDSVLTSVCNEFESQTQILNEREHDIRVAAEIGQALLEKNQLLQEDVLKHQRRLSDANGDAVLGGTNDVVCRFLRNELHQRGEEYCGDFDTDWATLKRMHKRDRQLMSAAVDERVEIEHENSLLQARVDKLQKQVILFNAMRQQAEIDRGEIDRLTKIIQDSHASRTRSESCDANGDAQGCDCGWRVRELEDQLSEQRAMHVTEQNRAHHVLVETRHRLARVRAEVAGSASVRETLQEELKETRESMSALRDECQHLRRHNQELMATLSSMSERKNANTGASSSPSVQQEAKLEWYRGRYEQARAELSRVRALKSGREWFNGLAKPRRKQKVANTEWARVLTVNKDHNNGEDGVDKGNNQTKHVTKDTSNAIQQSSQQPRSKQQLATLLKKYPNKDSSTNAESTYVLEKELNGPVTTNTANSVRRWDLIWRRLPQSQQY